jgi:hypothetical protein
MKCESIHSSTAIYLLQNRCKPSKRENRQNGNQESTREEGRRKEGAREEGRKKEVAVIQPTKGNTRGGRFKASPSVFLEKD